MLATELRALIPSAGSVTAIHTAAPTLERLSRQAAHLNISGPRQLLEAGIDWLGDLPGRTQDSGARVNYSYRDLAAALRKLFGPEAMSSGAETRYEEVAKVFRNSTAISGRRLVPRLTFHLAAAIVAKVHPVDANETSPSNRRQGDQATANTAPGTDFILERADSVMSLVELARQSQLLLIDGWFAPLRDAFKIRLLEEPDLNIASLFACNTDDWPDAERLALATILLVGCPNGADSSQGQLRDLVASLLQSHRISRKLPATLTFLRERAALALAHVGDPRPGVSTLEVGTPDHVFSLLPPAHGKDWHSFMSIYPVTRAQFLCRQQLPPLLPAHSWPTCNYPVTCVTTEEAEGYCEWLTSLLRDRKQFRCRAPSGEIRTRQLPDTHTWQLALPTQSEVAAAAGSGLFPWSTTIHDSIGIARRLSYSRLMPVGLFADEVAPGGVYDLSGLIWQWLREPWLQNDQSFPQHRCVYGGGYGKNINFFRCDTFLGAMSNTRRIDRGFRLVLRFKH